MAKVKDISKLWLLNLCLLVHILPTLIHSSPNLLSSCLSNKAYIKNPPFDKLGAGDPA